MTKIEDHVAQATASHLASRNGNRWNEDRCWYILREMLPRATDGYLQQLADRVRLELR